MFRTCLWIHLVKEILTVVSKQMCHVHCIFITFKVVSVVGFFDECIMKKKKNEKEEKTRSIYTNNLQKITASSTFLEFVYINENSMEEWGERIKDSKLSDKLESLLLIYFITKLILYFIIETHRLCLNKATINAAIVLRLHRSVYWQYDVQDIVYNHQNILPDLPDYTHNLAKSDE